MHSILKRGCTWTHCSFHSLWQETEIDSIHQLVVGATENVKEGNEDIREVTFPIWKQAAINSACVIYALCYVFLWLMSINLINKLILFTSITRQSKTMLASGFGSCSSWSCALSLSSSWTGMTANTASQHGLYNRKLSGSGTYWLSHKGEDDDSTETECSGDHAGPGFQSNKVFFMDILCSSGGDSLFFSDANHLISAFQSTSMEESSVWSTVCVCVRLNSQSFSSHN